MKQNLIISGIKEKKGEDCKEVAKQFFKNKLGIKEEIAIMTAHRIGKKDDDRNLIVKLLDVGNKATIYKHAKNLKDLKNEDGDGYYINNQLPEEREERNRLQKTKVKINKSLINAQRQSLEWKKGQLKVDGKFYELQIVKPSITEIIEMDTAQLKKILAQKLHQGAEFTKNGTKMFGFAAKVHSIEQVAECYKQLKYRFLDATHIVCAYRIMDPDVAHMQDCIDDGELGAGRKVLMSLIDNSVENVAVYVVRYHRGPNRASTVRDDGKRCKICNRHNASNPQYVCSQPA